MSERICAVIDSAEFCRNVHSDKKFLKASHDVFYLLNEYINKLNTTTEIYDSLLTVISSPDWEKLTFEDKMVATQLKTEFELNGIDKTEEEKEKIIEIQNMISVAGDKFVSERVVYLNNVTIPSQSIKSAPEEMKSRLKKKLFSSDKVTLLPSLEWLSYVDDSESRKKIYQEINKPIKLTPLADLLKYRDQFAKLNNYPTFAHHVLKNRVSD